MGEVACVSRRILAGGGSQGGSQLLTRRKPAVHVSGSRAARGALVVLCRVRGGPAQQALGNVLEERFMSGIEGRYSEVRRAVQAWSQNKKCLTYLDELRYLIF